MQVEPKDEEEVDELAVTTQDPDNAAAPAPMSIDADGRLGSGMDNEGQDNDEEEEEDKEGQAAAATLLQASTSLPSVTLSSTSDGPHATSANSNAEPSHQQQPHGHQQQQQQQQDQYAGPICANCSTQTTSLWRRSPEGQTLCNACSLYQKMKGTPRPVSLKTDVIKHRNRSKGDRKSAKAAAALAAAAAAASSSSNNAEAGAGQGGVTASTEGVLPPGSKAKKSSANINGNKTRQSSIAPSTASSAIREEQEEEMDDLMDDSYANTSVAASTEGGYDSSMNLSSQHTMHNNTVPSASHQHQHRLPNGMTEAEYAAAKKGRSTLLELSRGLHQTPLTPAQLHAQAAQQQAAASRRPPNATSPPVPSPNPYGTSSATTTTGVTAASLASDARSARAKELAAAYALANASGGAGPGAGIGRRAISVDGRLTPTHAPGHGHAPPIPWNIASYFSGMAERERQKQAAQAAAAHSYGGTGSSATATANTGTSTANSTRNNSRANSASAPNSAPSSATVSPTGTTLPDPPTNPSSSSSMKGMMSGLTPTQQAQAAAAAAAQAAFRAAPYQPHPHSNFLAAYRARQIAAQQTSEEYNSARAKAAAAADEQDKLDKEKKALQDAKSHSSSRNTGNGTHSTANMSETARIAHAMGWRPPSKDSPSSRSRHASPSVPGVYPRSASASREGSRHNTPPSGASGPSGSSSSTNYIQSHPTGPTRLLFGLPTLYPRSASNDRYGPGSSSSAAQRNAGSGPSGLRSFENMTDEDREKQKARLDQLFAAAGQRLSAAQQAQSQKAGTSSKLESAPPSTHATPQMKDLASVSAGAADSAVGRSPAPSHHAAYRPYDLAHRSSSRAANGGHSSAPSSTVLGPRTSPNHLTSSLNLGPNAIKNEKRPGSPGSLSSSSEHDTALGGRKRASLPSITSPLLDPTCSPPFSGIPYPGKGIISQVVPFLGEDSMAIDEVDEDELAALEDQEGLDGLPGLRNIASARAAHRDAASHSPPFGVALGPSASERRGRSTTRKARDTMGEDEHLAHHSGDYVAHELGAMKMRDSSRSSQIRTDSRSPDRFISHQLPHQQHLKAYNQGIPPAEKFPELPRFSHISQMVHAQVNNMAPSSGAGFPRSTIPTAELDDGIVKNALTHRPISDLRAFGSPHPTLPSLSEALSSSASSRSLSASRTGSSRHSSAARTAMSHRSMMDEGGVSSSSSGGMLPPPASLALEEVARMRTRIQELEFINGLMESRVAELEGALVGNPDKAGVMVMAPHGPNCSCRCSEIDSESLKAAEHLKKELLTHGVGGIGEQASRDLLDLLAHRLGYKPGAGTPGESRPPSANETKASTA